MFPGFRTACRDYFHVMKTLLLISLFCVPALAFAQTDWSAYSTSVEKTNGRPALGVAIPYNGNYDNFDRKVVGISHWNPGYRLGIDTALDAQTPLYFVYDTAGIFFLLPQVHLKNAQQYQFSVLRNNTSIISPWAPVQRFSPSGVGELAAGFGMAGPYSVGLGEYLVAQVRDAAGTVISSAVVYGKKSVPEIRMLSTADTDSAFAPLVLDENTLVRHEPNLGWHRRYTTGLAGDTTVLQLAHNENNVLVSVDAAIFQAGALEYALFEGDEEVRQWAGHEYPHPYILLKNLRAGDYRLLIRFRRQPGSVRELRFSVAPTWYKTTAFKASVSTFVALTAAFLVFASKYGKQRSALALAQKKAEHASGELQHIHALLNPHFTFNALSSIQGLVNKGEMTAASQYLSAFGALLRETLNESKADHIPLTKELENLHRYVRLEQLRHSFDYQLQMDENVDTFTTTIPPFLLQPFVENAIKHGLAGMNGKGALRLAVQKADNTLLVTITDNGPGFDTAAVQAGHGLRLSRQRIDLLNRGYGEELIALRMDSSGTGTSISLAFKNWL